MTTAREDKASLSELVGIRLSTIRQLKLQELSRTTELQQFTPSRAVISGPELYIKRLGSATCLAHSVVTQTRIGGTSTVGWNDGSPLIWGNSSYSNNNQADILANCKLLISGQHIRLELRSTRAQEQLLTCLCSSTRQQESRS